MADSAFGLARLDGKVALITGASSGIGAGTAHMFAKLGARLALTGRNEDNLNKHGDECEKLGGNKVLCLPGDLTIEEDVKRIVNEAVKHYGRLDILVNNAGIGELGTIENTSLEQFDWIMNINVRAMYHITMLAVPHLVQTKGSIVNVSSVNGIRSFPNVLAYNMSKSAVDQFTRCCALDLAPKQVRVNSVNPGVIITEIHKRGGLDDEAYQMFLDRTKFTHALGRPGQVEEVSAMIAFLASENASFITGAQIPIDGGRHAMCPR
ncbi:3-oxoacyl-[acyl-carrier-protein] reductase FabG-like isoform X2 [Ruditapes philippinarum]|uniref:3-oxoacyl-[acyl-carrier-protein] reductase FabG-like isoform X2 n=1 Tax=Ruditapes philippinarum TaxID=129788 RepID=UPI00295BC5FC|nr:3-oxoacyl-[acyl-carrier-protein] reductase FabG-like isoform X2 [Ruditapes philippinarum]